MRLPVLKLSPPKMGGAHSKWVEPTQISIFLHSWPKKSGSHSTLGPINSRRKYRIRNLIHNIWPEFRALQMLWIRNKKTVTKFTLIDFLDSPYTYFWFKTRATVRSVRGRVAPLPVLVRKLVRTWHDLTLLDLTWRIWASHQGISCDRWGHPAHMWAEPPRQL